MPMTEFVYPDDPRWTGRNARPMTGPIGQSDHVCNASEIALDDVADPVHVLDGQRLVQPERFPQPNEIFLRGLRAEHDLGRIPRREVQEPEADDRYPHQDRHQQQEPAGEVAPHESRVTSARSSRRGGRSSDGA